MRVLTTIIILLAVAHSCLFPCKVRVSPTVVVPGYLTWTVEMDHAVPCKSSLAATVYIGKEEWQDTFNYGAKALSGEIRITREDAEKLHMMEHVTVKVYRDGWPLRKVTVPVVFLEEEAVE